MWNERWAALWELISHRIDVEDRCESLRKMANQDFLSPKFLEELRTLEATIKVYEEDWVDCPNPTWVCGTSTGLIFIQGTIQTMDEIRKNMSPAWSHTMQAERGFLGIYTTRELPLMAVPLWTWAADRLGWLLVF